MFCALPNELLLIVLTNLSLEHAIAIISSNKCLYQYYTYLKISANIHTFTNIFVKFLHFHQKRPIKLLILLCLQKYKFQFNPTIFKSCLSNFRSTCMNQETIKFINIHNLEYAISLINNINQSINIHGIYHDCVFYMKFEDVNPSYFKSTPTAMSTYYELNYKISYFHASSLLKQIATILNYKNFDHSAWKTMYEDHNLFVQWFDFCIHLKTDKSFFHAAQVYQHFNNHIWLVKKNRWYELHSDEFKHVINACLQEAQKIKLWHKSIFKHFLEMHKNLDDNDPFKLHIHALNKIIKPYHNIQECDVYILHYIIQANAHNLNYDIYIFDVFNENRFKSHDFSNILIWLCRFAISHPSHSLNFTHIVSRFKSINKTISKGTEIITKIHQHFKYVVEKQKFIKLVKSVSSLYIYTYLSLHYWL